MTHQDPSFLSGASRGIPNVPMEWLIFFFVFASVYGILTTTGPKEGGLFGNNAVNTLIAVVFALFAAANQPFVSFFEANFIVLVWVFIGLFVVAFLLEVVGLRGLPAREKAKKHANYTIVLGGFTLLVLASFGFGLLKGIEVPVIGTRNAITIVGLLFIIQIFHYAYHSGKGD